MRSNYTTTYPNKYYDQKGTTKTRYLFANNDLIASIETTGLATTTYTTHLDHLGGTNIVTDLNGYVTQTLSYYPFGQTRVNAQLSDTNERHKFTGHQLDDSTGLYYMQARYQAPNIGRFVSEDPSFLDIGIDRKKDYIQLSQPQKLNSYTYADNNPLTNIDPDGKDSLIAFMLNLNFVNNQTGGLAGATMQNELTGYAQAGKASALVGGGAAMIVAATMMPGAAPELYGAVGNVAVRAYNDMQDGRIDDSLGQYAGSAGFGAAGAKLTVGRSLGTTILTSGTLTGVEGVTLDGKIRKRDMLANAAGVVLGKMSGVAATMMGGGGRVVNAFAQTVGQVAGTIGISQTSSNGYVPKNLRQSLSTYTGSLTEWAKGKRSK